jgi:O-antigen ligase
MVVDRVTLTPVADPASIVIFLAVFVIAAVGTMRRAAYGAAALACVIPFDWAHAIAGTTITLGKATLAGVLIGLCAQPATLAALRRHDIRRIALASCGMLAAIAATALIARDRPAAIHEIFRWVEYTLVFVAIAVAYAMDPDDSVVRTALFASILCACVSAFCDLLFGAPYGMWLGSIAVPRISGLLDGPNQLAGYLEIAAAAAGTWQLRAPSRLSSLALVFAGIAVPLTFSRAAIAGIVAILVVFLFDTRRSLRSLQRAQGFIYGLLGGLAVVFFWEAMSHQSIATSLIRASDMQSGASGGLGTRSQLWRAAFFFFRHHPLLGIGAGNYELELADAGVFGVRTHANNWYLQALAEGGIVLFAATIAWLAAVASSTWSHLRSSPWGLAAFAATIAMIVHGFLDYLVFYPKVAEAWIVLIALGVASGNPRAIMTRP